MKKNPFLRVLGLMVGTLFLLSFRPATNSDAVVGTWLTGSKKGHVQIYKQGGQYFGKIVWLKEPNDPLTASPRLDSKNPDASKRKQPLQGLVNLRGFTHAGGNTWENGKIYDPENGKEYSCKLTLRDNNTLDVRGYVGFSIIGRTDTWQRVKP